MPLTTLSHKLFVARAQAVASSTFSDALATGGDFGSKPTGTIDILDAGFLDPTVGVEKNVSVHPVSKVNGITFSFAGGNANDDTFTWKLFAWRNENGPATLAADGTGILGTQKVVKWPHNNLATTDLNDNAVDRFWADTIVVSNDYWIKEIEATALGSNSVSNVWIDAAGYRYFFVEIDSQDGSDMAVYFGYW